MMTGAMSRSSLPPGAGPPFRRFLGLPIPAAVAYGAIRVIRAAGRLRAVRSGPSAGHERPRVAPDVEDLLSQSLSAVSFKGDLALRLLPDDPTAARAEIESLTAAARGALHKLHGAGRGGEYPVTLRTEADGAMRLLAAAGIDTRVNVDVYLSQPAAGVLGWALREGVTNVLAHAEASTCSITASRSQRSVRLEIAHDGARTLPAPGNGLARLTSLVRAMNGSVTAGLTGDGGYRLLVEFPEEAT
jgi:two-component system, NarL family, sensor histidine kinase DesK